MTRRANSFKRCPGGEIELQISGSPRSPRTDGLGSPPKDAAEASSSSAYASGSAASPGGLHHQQQLRFRLFKRPGAGGGAGDVVLGLGIRERRKLGNLLFFAFCGVCLLLGVVKIWAGGRSALPAGDDLQVWKLQIAFLFRLPAATRACSFRGINQRTWCSINSPFFFSLFTENVFILATS